jgi:DUF1365 family protein
MRPVEHAFTYRLFMMYLDLAEADGVFRRHWLWSTRRRAVARFRREDHLGDPSTPLDRAVRDLVAERTGKRPAGPIRLLTHLGYFGYRFNPVSFYYCFDSEDQKVETIVAEVNNTPWGEQHCYVLDDAGERAEGHRMRYRPAKVMHVSPFMEMDVDYDWRFSTPGPRLDVHMQNERNGQKIFDATLSLERKEISSGSLARVLIVYPLVTLKVILAIHWQALLLWLKGVPVQDHPDKAAKLQRKNA